ncbi:MAG: hypothetical protein PHU79_04960, partial [Oscillospiraceae bacterium]|nr:hypothetical protein [Oscillospiraceae bacterium]
QQQEVHRRVAADASKHHLATLAAKDKVAEETKADHKDIVAMILALFRVLLPWILGAIAIFFVVIFLITRI